MSPMHQYPHVVISPNTKRDVDEVKLENFKENVRKSMRFQLDRYQKEITQEQKKAHIDKMIASLKYPLKILNHRLLPPEQMSS